VPSLLRIKIRIGLAKFHSSLNIMCARASSDDGKDKAHPIIFWL
jgi:hypothetical protein